VETLIVIGIALVAAMGLVAQLVRPAGRFVERRFVATVGT